MKTKNLKALIDELQFECLAGEKQLDTIPVSAYVSDLLSDVMGNAVENMIWITSQIHNNIIAVASLKELSAIVVVNERPVGKELIELAEEEGIVLIASNLPAFETIGRLYNFLNSET